MALLRVLALMGLLCGCLAASPCDGPAAKLRYQFMYKLKAGVKVPDVEAAARQWMEGCKAAGLVRYGLGPTLTSDPAAYGSPSKGAFADFAVWSDWNALADIKKCQELSLKSGVAQKTRAFADKAARVVYQLPATGAGNPKPAQACAAATSYAPAAVRYLWTYVVPAGTTPQTCAKIDGLEAAIVASKPGDWVRAARGCDAVADDAAFYAPNIKNTADYGGFIDFPSPQAMTKYLSSTSPATLAARTESRSLSSDAMRGAIALPAAAPTAAKPK